MIEIDWLPELMQYPDKFVDLTDPALDGRWLDWKVAQATTPDGVLLGYGTDIGPEAIAFRGDLFAAAGLPSTVRRSPPLSVAPTPRGTTTSPSASSTPTPRASPSSTLLVPSTRA